MIRQVDGKWVSVRTEAELKKDLDEEMARLSPDEKIALQLMLAEVQSGSGGMINAIQDMEYGNIPVGPKEFLEDPYYFGEVAQGMYPKLREDFIKLFSGGYEEAVFSGSIGWGKSFFATCAIIYVLYQLTCLRDPARTYGLAGGSQLHLVNLSARKDTAQRVVFEGIADKLTLSPYFKELGFDRKKDELRFPKNVVVLGGESTDTSVLGLSVIGAVVDETNFMRGQVSKQNMARWHHYGRAELLYSAIKTRMQSRFMKSGQVPGLLILVSSRQVPDDFTETRIRQSVDDPKVFVLDYALWDVKPDNYSAARFKVFVGAGGQKPRILEVNEPVELHEGERVVDVPVDFRQRFEENLTGSLRDIAGVSVVTITTFIQNREQIYRCIDKTRTHAFSVEEWDPSTEGRFLWDKLVRKGETGEMEPIHFPHATRYVHIDPSIRGDATGFAMGCVCGFKKVVRTDETGKRYEEDAPLIWIDVALKIVPPRGGEIFLGDVRNLVYQLSEHGFPVAKASMDSFQSIESIQNFKLKGYQAEIISVDTDVKPYQLMKGTIYEGRLSYYEYPPLIAELRDLELDWVRRKVDHPASGSKDVADAVCGVVYSLAEKYSKKGGSSPYGAAPMHGIVEDPHKEEYIPSDSKHPKAGDIIWGDEYENELLNEHDEQKRLLDKKRRGEKEKEEEDEGDGTMPPFFMG